ncbi:hypothetical protein [Pseudomonas brassicacearum]|uniref:hypothetical protein n=1 Tax=Pseudomonas brassicacearum TaxID=930166 RepID=UPI00118405A7|nr:hypothetical protein [Pseudomonas brassicacearum]
MPAFGQRGLTGRLDQDQDQDPKQSKAKQSKAKQSKAKQSKAKQSKAKQSKAKQSKAKQSKAKQSKAKQQRGISSIYVTEPPPSRASSLPHGLVALTISG